jgi:hypothetical protein
MKDVLEFAGIFAVILIVMVFFERALAANAQAQADLATQRTWTNLVGETGNDLLGLWF